MQPKELTGWLVLLIIWIGLIWIGGGVRNLGEVATAYAPYFSDYPALRAATIAFQILGGAGIATWAYTAWLLYRRERGTLARAKITLLAGASLRIAAAFSIPLFAELPRELSDPMMQQAVMMGLFVAVFTGVWHQYLVRSRKVREIFDSH